MNQQNQSPLDQEPIASRLKELIAHGESNTFICLTLWRETNGDVKPTEASIRRFRKRHGLTIPGQERAYTRVSGDTAEAATEPSTDKPVLDDPDTMLRQRGLNPLEWFIDSVTANEYQGPNSRDAVEAGGSTKVTYYQTKFTAKRRTPMHLVLPARSDGWKPDRRPVRMSSRHAIGHRLIVICGDQQAPFHDENLDRLFREWLAANSPNEGVLLGDTVDFPDVSRHPFDPESNATVNECIQSGYNVLRGYVDASEQTEWSKLMGNHDERIRNYTLKQARELYGVRRATRPGEEPEKSVLSLDHLLRLDELGIELIDPHGPYDQAQLNLSSKLAVRHGWKVKPNSGQTAYANLDHLGYSIVVGHTHRQGLVHKTGHDIDGNIFTLASAEAGCMCTVAKKETRIKTDIITANGEIVHIDTTRVWPNYAVTPDWQQGFATVTIWDDGKFKIDLATYVNQTLLWRDQKYV